MAITFTNNPTVGGNAGDWGTILNNILTELKAAANTLDSGKSDSDHTHSVYATESDFTTAENRITALESLVAFMNPDLSAVVVSAGINNSAAGVQVVVSTTPSIYVREYHVEIRVAGSVVHTAISASNVFQISENVGFTTGDDIDVRVWIVSGMSSTKYSDWYTHYYNNAYPALSVGDIVTAFKDDSAAIQELANALHNSNVLAQKIAELSV